MNIYEKKRIKRRNEILRRFEFGVETIAAYLSWEQFLEFNHSDQLDKIDIHKETKKREIKDSKIF